MRVIQGERMRIGPGLLCVLLVSTPVVAAADTARAVVMADGKTVAFNRILPAGEDVTIELPAPGEDEIAGTVAVWPTTDRAGCPAGAAPTEGVEPPVPQQPGDLAV